MNVNDAEDKEENDEEGSDEDSDEDNLENVTDDVDETKIQWDPGASQSKFVKRHC